MKIIPLGLQCSVPDAIKYANLRTCSYPFDWLWSPSATTYDILKMLFEEGVEKTVCYMTSGYTYYKYLGNEHYIPSQTVTESQMNKTTGLGITHFTINDEYKSKLTRRLERMRTDILSQEKIMFIYADAASPELNYHLDDVEYGLDATENLAKIYTLMYSLNNNIQIVYFCWQTRLKEHTHIVHVPFSSKPHWHGVSDVIIHYLRKHVH